MNPVPISTILNSMANKGIIKSNEVTTFERYFDTRGVYTNNDLNRLNEKDWNDFSQPMKEALQLVCPPPQKELKRSFKPDRPTSTPVNLPKPDRPDPAVTVTNSPRTPGRDGQKQKPIRPSTGPTNTNTTSPPPNITSTTPVISNLGSSASLSSFTNITSTIDFKKFTLSSPDHRLSMKHNSSYLAKRELTFCVTYLDYTPRDIAEQLCLICQSIFEQISPVEFDNLNWTKKQKKSLSPFLERVSEFFNHFAQWIQTQILCEIDPGRRMLAVMHTFRIAQELLELKNYLCVMGICAALAASPLYRLNSTFSLLDNEYKTFHESLKLLSNPASNYKELRIATHQPTPAPVIPYLGIYLTDLVYAVEKKDETQREKIMTEIGRFLSSRYVLVPNPILQHVLRADFVFNEDQLFKLSSYIEPKGNDKRSSTDRTPPEIRELLDLKDNYIQSNLIPQIDALHFLKILSTSSAGGKEYKLVGENGFSIYVHEYLLKTRFPQLTLSDFTDFTKTSLKVFVHFIYEDQLDSQLASQLKVDEQFFLWKFGITKDLNRFTFLIGHYLYTHMTIENSIQYGTAALKYNIKSLFGETLKIIAANKYKSIRQELDALNKDIAMELLMTDPKNFPRTLSDYVPSNIYNEVSKLVNREINTDVVLMIQDCFGEKRNFPCHKSVILHACPYFKKHDWNSVHSTPFPTPIFEEFLLFLYTSTLKENHNPLWTLLWLERFGSMYALPDEFTISQTVQEKILNLSQLEEDELIPNINDIFTLHVLDEFEKLNFSKKIIDEIKGQKQLANQIFKLIENVSLSERKGLEKQISTIKSQIEKCDKKK